jgi:hypothetical protein
MNRGFAPAIAVIALAAALVPAAAQDPAGACTVEPRTPREVAVVAGTPEPSPVSALDLPVIDDATPAPPREPSGPGIPDRIVLPSGDPAPGDVVAGIAATMEQFTACTNAGEALRMMALVSDDFLRGGFAGRALDEADVISFAGTPRPLDPAEQRDVATIRQPQLLGPGLAAALVDLAALGGPVPGEIRTDYVVFSQHGDRWLIEAYAANLPPDEFGPNAAPPATPTP